MELSINIPCWVCSSGLIVIVWLFLRLVIVAGLLFSAYAFATGSLSAGLSGIGISLALAIAGAPLMALGTIATNSKRQTALIALQTWTNAPID